MQAELVRLGELADAGAEGHQLVTAHGGRQLDDAFRGVEDAVILQAEAVDAVRSVEKQLHIVADANRKARIKVRS